MLSSCAFDRRANKGSLQYVLKLQPVFGKFSGSGQNLRMINSRKEVLEICTKNKKHVPPVLFHLKNRNDVSKCLLHVKVKVEDTVLAFLFALRAGLISFEKCSLFFT